MGKKINELEVTEKENFQNEKPRQTEKKKTINPMIKKAQQTPNTKKTWRGIPQWCRG